MLRQGLKTISWMVVAVGLGVLLIWGFLEGRRERATEQERERPIKAPSRVSVEAGEPVVALDPSIQASAGIRTVSLESILRQEKVRAYGTVIDPQGLADLQSRYLAARSELEKTQAGLEASRREYHRLKGLYDRDRNISDKALQAAEATWRVDAASAEAAGAASHALETAIRQQWGSTLARWLIEGSDRFDRLMAQADLLLQVTLPAGEKIGSAPPTATVQAADGKLFSIQLISPSPRADPKLQGQSYFYLASSEKTGFLPGMNILVFLPKGPNVQGVVIPASAVVFWQGKGWIYLQKRSDRFTRREIPTERPTEAGWFVIEGFSPGDRVVSEGAQLLLSEELRAQIQIGEEGER